MVTAAVSFCVSEPPKFTRTPARVSVVRPGQNTVFECQVTGTPEIDMYWFKEGTEISPSDQYKMAFVNSVATLEVCGADTKDSGLYYCEARNEAGSESCSMELKVKGRSISPKLCTGLDKSFNSCNFVKTSLVD